MMLKNSLGCLVQLEAEEQGEVEAVNSRWVTKKWEDFVDGYRHSTYTTPKLGLPVAMKAPTTD